jgi:hypothetical protein
MLILLGKKRKLFYHIWSKRGRERKEESHFWAKKVPPYQLIKKIHST